MLWGTFPKPWISQQKGGQGGGHRVWLGWSTRPAQPLHSPTWSLQQLLLLRTIAGAETEGYHWVSTSTRFVFPSPAVIRSLLQQGPKSLLDSGLLAGVALLSFWWWRGKRRGRCREGDIGGMRSSSPSATRLHEQSLQQKAAHGGIFIQNSPEGIGAVSRTQAVVVVVVVLGGNTQNSMQSGAA